MHRIVNNNLYEKAFLQPRRDGKQQGAVLERWRAERFLLPVIKKPLYIAICRAVFLFGNRQKVAEYGFWVHGLKSDVQETLISSRFHDVGVSTERSTNAMTDNYILDILKKYSRMKESPLCAAIIIKRYTDLALR